MAEVRKTPAEQPELRPSAPHQGGPLASSGAAPGGDSDKADLAAATAGTEPAEASTGKAAAEDVTAPGATETGATATATVAGGGPQASSVTKAGSDAGIPEKTAGKGSADEEAEPGKVGADEDAAAKTEPGKDGAAKAEPDKDRADKDAAGKDELGKSAAGKDAAGTSEVAAKSDAAATTGSGKAAAEAKAAPRTRRFRPLHAVGRAGGATVAWARRPSGRVILPGIVVVVLVALAGTSGAYLVPRALEAPAPTTTPTFGASAAAPPAASGPAAFPSTAAPVTGTLPPGFTPPVPGGTGLPTTGAATGLPTAQPPGLPTLQPTAAVARPADALAGWAGKIGTQVGIPVVAVQAYGYAELIAAKTTPSCHLSWTTLAAIAKVESEHGSSNGAVLGVDGMAQPTIYGLPLDGQGGRQRIVDTDQGALDGDATFDRAVGPMQFIPGTWRENAVDADRNGVTEPSDIDDAALTAAVHLCKGGRDLAKAQSWWDAILSYNALQPYAEKVFTTADEYGRRSRT